MYESGKRGIPVRIEVRSGSVESTILLLAGLAEIGAFAFAVVSYIRSRRQKEKPIEIKRFNKEWGYAYAYYYLKTKAHAPRAKLIEERKTSEGNCFLRFEDSLGNFHNLIITKDFDIEYNRSTFNRNGEEIRFT